MGSMLLLLFLAGPEGLSRKNFEIWTQLSGVAQTKDCDLIICSTSSYVPTAISISVWRNTYLYHAPAWVPFVCLSRIGTKNFLQAWMEGYRVTVLLC
jgi:hypothetical protein